MPAMSPVMPTYVVRYPKASMLPAMIFLAVAIVGFRMAITGRGHWTYWHVALFASLGIWFLFYVQMYRTVFSADGVEQRVFPGLVRRFGYVDIQRIKAVWAGRGIALVILSRDGRKMKVYGADEQLRRVQDELFDRIPQAFET
jgi:hypothetical protein